MLGPAAREGFETGKHKGDKLVKGTYSRGEKLIRPPFKFIESALQRSTVIINSILPKSFIQLPWPSLFDENSLPPNIKVKPNSVKRKGSHSKSQGPSQKAKVEESAPEEKKGEIKKEPEIAPTESSNEIPESHAKVYVGPSLDGNEPAKEFSIPEAQLNDEGAKAHLIKEKDGKKSQKEKMGKGPVKERPKTLFDRIEMPKPSAEASISKGDGGAEPSTSTLERPGSCSSTATPTSPTISVSAAPSTSTSASSPAVKQSSKILEREKGEGEEDGGKDSTEVTPITSEAVPKPKKKNNKKKSNRGRGRGGGNVGSTEASTSGGQA